MIDHNVTPIYGQPNELPNELILFLNEIDEDFKNNQDARNMSGK